MEPIIKEKETVYAEGYGGWGGNTRGKANAGLALGIIGTVLGGAALARQGGIGGILGGGGSTSSVTYNTGSPASCAGNLLVKECDDVLAITKGYYDLAISGMRQAAQAREVDVAEKFGLFINNRNSIDALSDKTNAAFFDLYKYTRDKDDETSDKISALESQVAVNAAIRPYQDKLIQCEIEKSFAWLKNYVDSNLCNVIRGVNVLPLTPEVTGVYSQTCCNRFLAAAAAAAATAPAPGA
jgi:hypothetical protein